MGIPGVPRTSRVPASKWLHLPITVICMYSGGEDSPVSCGEGKGDDRQEVMSSVRVAVKMRPLVEGPAQKSTQRTQQKTG